MAAQFCPYCGKPVTAGGATFCAFCGRSLTGQAPAQPPAQAAPPLPAQPLPPGAHPPGMVAVPVAVTPVEGPPLTGVATGPAYYQAPPPAAGAGYPLPGYTAPPPAYGTYGTYAAPAYTSVAGARPAFSTARAVWCAIAVAVLGMVVALDFGFGRGVLGPGIRHRLLVFYYVDPQYMLDCPLALGIPTAFWLGLARLAYTRAWRAWAEALGITVALTVAMVLVTLLVLRSVYSNDAYYTVEVEFWHIVVVAVIGGLIAGAIGAGLAAAFATWPAVRAQRVLRGAGARTLLALGIFVVANLAHTAVDSVGADRFFYVDNDRVGLLLVVPVVIAITWYTAWSTLRLLRQAVPAPSIPVATGV